MIARVNGQHDKSNKIRERTRAHGKVFKWRRPLSTAAARSAVAAAPVVAAEAAAARAHWGGHEGHKAREGGGACVNRAPHELRRRHEALHSRFNGPARAHDVWRSTRTRTTTTETLPSTSAQPVMGVAFATVVRAPDTVHRWCLQVSALTFGLSCAGSRSQAWPAATSRSGPRQSHEKRTC
jgi:hypothetical protein